MTDWLGFFSTQADWAPLREEYALLQQRQQQIQAPWRCPGGTASGIYRWTRAGRAALKQLLKQLQPQPVDNFSHHWRLPPNQPLPAPTVEATRAGLIRGQTSAHRGLRTFAQDRSRGRQGSVGADVQPGAGG
ncbi:MAG: hypothetical protein MUW57_05735 [Pseudomonas sp.]|nr:hypothetical protein [Pseudomonas sp.]